MLDAETVVRRKQGLVASTMDGETVMLDMESGRYFGLSGVAPHIWSMLDVGSSVGEIVGGVKSMFAVGTADNVEQDVKTFLQQLIDKGLVTVVA